MSSIAIPHTPAAPPARRGLSPWQTWGLILLAPYVLVFLAFVLYPVGYGLWLPGPPEGYVKRFNRPVFFRPIVNTTLFLPVAVYLEFRFPLGLGGFFTLQGGWIPR